MRFRCFQRITFTGSDEIEFVSASFRNRAIGSFFSPNLEGFFLEKFKWWKKSCKLIRGTRLLVVKVSKMMYNFVQKICYEDDFIEVVHFKV